MSWIDISQPLNHQIAGWPGDTRFAYEVEYSKKDTGSVNIGKITMSLHTGTHIDAPYHFDESGARVDELDVNLYIGPCQIIDVSEFQEITADLLSHFTINKSSRLLLKTALPNDPTIFPDVFPLLTIKAIDYLKDQGIKLLGVDTPSVDLPDSKQLPIHHHLHQSGIHILENVMLDHVEPGDYELSALPLAISDADGSPVRAVIRPLKGDSL